MTPFNPGVRTSASQHEFETRVLGKDHPFSSGLRYDRMNTKTICAALILVLALVFGVSAVRRGIGPALGQSGAAPIQQSGGTLSYLNIPVPKDSGIPNALWAAQEAHDQGWDGVEVGIGSTSNGLTRDWSGLKKLADLTASLKLRIHLRLLESADANLYKNGVATPSWWAVTYNDGVPWPQPFRLPPKVAAACAKLLWQKGFDITYAAYQAHGLDPTTYITCEAANEAGIAGSGGPMLGSWSSSRSTWRRFQKEWANARGDRRSPDFEAAHKDYVAVLPEALWRNGDPKLEGYIEPEFFAMLRTMLSNFDSKGCKVFPLTLKSTVGEEGQREIDSYTGPDVAWIASHYEGRGGFNCYMSPAASTVAECARNYLAREQEQVARMRKNPYFSGELFDSEFGMENDSNHIRGNLGIAQGRQAVLMAERKLTNVAGGAFFTSIGSNRLEENFNLYTPDHKPVGDFVVSPTAAGH
jgi:hypothetical protein